MSRRGVSLSVKSVAKLDALALAAGSTIAALALIAFAGSARDDFAELALGRETRSLYAEMDGVPIHCKAVPDARACVDGHATRGGRAVLWLGNSQLHGVNQLKPGDETAPATLHRVERARGRDVLAFSQPNASPQEHLVLFLYLAERLPLEAVILALVFDDFREDGLRQDVVDALADPEVVRALERYPIGRTLLANHAQRTGGSLAALEGTVQHRVEATASDWLEAHSTLWKLRPQARGALFSTLYRLRNSVFGITAQSKRHMIPGRLIANLGAARVMLEEARRREIEAIVYVAPLRGDVATPYVEAEYSEFKETLSRLARDTGASFANLEALVSAEHWGSQDAIRLDGGGELDFMHFQAAGHAQLAAAIGELLRDPRGARR